MQRRRVWLLLAKLMSATESYLAQRLLPNCLANANILASFAGVGMGMQKCGLKQMF